MKKIVRLTERDLTRIVKRVLNEQSMPDIPKEVLTCAGIDKAMKIKSCQSVIMSLIQKTTPDFTEMGQCTMEVVSNAPEFIMNGLECIKNKIAQNPVMY